MGKILIICIVFSLSAVQSKGLSALPVAPFVVWDIDFNAEKAGSPPSPLSAEQIEAAGKDVWKTLPIKTYFNIDFVTRTRTAIVREKAFGLEDQPMVFDMPDNHHPHWGPRVSFRVPHQVAGKTNRIRLSLDVSKNNVSKCGGFSLAEIAEIHFFEDGSVKAGKTEVTRYRPNKPIHFDFEIDNTEKTVTITIDGDTSKKTDLPWRNPNAQLFSYLRLDGLMPGGFAYGPAKIAFDNIQLTVIEWKKE